MIFNNFQKIPTFNSRKKKIPGRDSNSNKNSIMLIKNGDVFIGQQSPNGLINKSLNFIHQTLTGLIVSAKQIRLCLCSLRKHFANGNSHCIDNESIINRHETKMRWWLFRVGPNTCKMLFIGVTNAVTVMMFGAPVSLFMFVCVCTAQSFGWTGSIQCQTCTVHSLCDCLVYSFR